MILYIIGPTGSGKTELSIELAYQLNAEIISVDSRQSYKYLDVGTSKPEKKYLQEIIHYNISLFDLKEKDNIHAFYQRCQKWQNDILKRNKPIIYVGGSTLYLSILIQHFDKLPKRNEHNSIYLETLGKLYGIEYLYNKLKLIDPNYAHSIDGLNPHRIIRALDVYMQTKLPFSFFHNQKNVLKKNTHGKIFALYWKKSELYKRIEKRLYNMMNKNWIDEVEYILKKGYNEENPGLKTIGYSDIIAYLKHDLSYEEMLSNILKKNMQYAKKQQTWFNRYSDIHWIDSYNFTTKQKANYILQHWNKSTNSNL